ARLPVPWRQANQQRRSGLQCRGVIERRDDWQSSARARALRVGTCRKRVSASVAVIIDCHCHAGKGDGLTGPWDTAAPLGKYREWADAYGITHTILFAAFHSDYAIANRQVAAIVARNRALSPGFAFVHPDRDGGRVRQLVAAAIEHYGFRGIKVHRHDGRITREICDVARAFGVPVLYDVMGEVSVVHLLAVEYPDVAFV